MATKIQQAIWDNEDELVDRYRHMVEIADTFLELESLGATEMRDSMKVIGVPVKARTSAVVLLYKFRDATVAKAQALHEAEIAKLKAIHEGELAALRGETNE